MSTGADVLRPPPERGISRALGLAALVHLLLVALVSFGVHWHSHTPEAVEAELWSPTVHLEGAPPAPAQAPEPQPTPQVQPRPQPQVQPQPVTGPDDAEIALQRARQEKQHQRQQQRLALEQQQRDQRRQQLALQQAQELKAEQQKAERRKAEQQAQAQQLQQAEHDRAARDRQQRDQAKQQKQARADYMKNLLSQAGAGSGTGTGGGHSGGGDAVRSSGPSGGYGARLSALVKQHVVYPQVDQIDGNPKVVVSVTLDPNTGEVVGARVKRSSGVPSWDDAVVRAVLQVGRFPSDAGRWYTPMDVQAGPRDDS